MVADATGPEGFRGFGKDVVEGQVAYGFEAGEAG